jgi:hypothetical protein
MSDLSHREHNDTKSVAKNDTGVLADPAVLSFLCGFNKRAGQYKETEVEEARQVVTKGETLLSSPTIHDSKGISRDDLRAAEGRGKVTQKDHMSFAALNCLEPGVQESWQVPQHRAHLKDRSDAEFYKNCAQLLLKGGDKEWAGELTSEAKKVDARADKELSQDSIKQSQVFFGTRAIDAAKLEQLKEAGDRVHLALNILPNVDKRAVELLKAIDPKGYGVSNAELEQIIKNPPASLSAEDRVLLKAVATINEKGQEKSLDLDPGSKIGSGPGQRPVIVIGKATMSAALKVWAQGEVRNDELNPEKLFYSAVEGYNGRSLDIRKQDKFVEAMQSKDASQLQADRRARDYNRVPHFPSGQ